MASASCIFCQIIEKKSPANIIFENDEIIIFTDIRPAAKHHYLIVPKKHIKDVKQLTREDVPLVESLVQQARTVLEDNSADLQLSRWVIYFKRCPIVCKVPSR